MVDYFPMISPWLTSHCCVCHLRVWPTAIPIGMPLPERRIRPAERPQRGTAGNLTRKPYTYLYILHTYTQRMYIDIYIYKLYIIYRVHNEYNFIYIYKVNNVYVYIYKYWLYIVAHIFCYASNITSWDHIDHAAPSSFLP